MTYSSKVTPRDDRVTRWGYSGCDILWFTQTPRDFGNFRDATIAAIPTASFSGQWLRAGRWLTSGSPGSTQNDIIGCSWQKTVDEKQPSGVLTVTLKPGRPWKKLIRAGDALLVFMSSLDEKEQNRATLITLAFVDGVGEGLSVDASGAIVAGISVSARDMGKVLEESSLVSDPAFLAEDQIFWNQELLSKQIDRVLSPTETILNLIDVFFATPGASELVRAQWRFPGAEDVPIGSFLDVSTFVQAPTFGYGIHNFPVAESGTLWRLLMQYQNPDVNEMFVDVRDVMPEALACHEYQENLAKNFVDPDDARLQATEKRRVWNNLLALSDVDRHRFSRGDEAIGNVPRNPLTPTDTGLIPTRLNFSKWGSSPASLALVFRQRPYDTGTFFKLPEVLVDETEVIRSELRSSYANAQNFFRLHAITLPPQLQEQVFGIMINRESIARFGLRRREIETLYPFATSQLAFDISDGRQQEVSFSPIYEYYVWLVSTWNAFNELFDEGPLTLVFRPDIRCGVRLRLHRRLPGGLHEDTHFYVQAVNQVFAFDAGQSSTRVTLVRGISGSTQDQNPAANLYWTENKRWLPVRDPFDYYVNRLMRKPPNDPGSIEPVKVPGG